MASKSTRASSTSCLNCESHQLVGNARDDDMLEHGQLGARRRREEMPGEEDVDDGVHLHGI
jgi:hypothetical protein